MKNFIAIFVASLLTVSTSFADVIFTKSGSTINGKIQGITGGKIKITTDFAGEIEVDQTHVETITTDEPIFVSFESGASYVGILKGSGNKEL
ncbi:MAG: hypothetical protein HOL92_18870, partial [Opitutales bacterium]|nr:hypothetical protein [Opitutales bacterium]